MNERPTAIAGLLSCVLAVICFIFLLYAGNGTEDVLSLLFVVFVFLAIVFSAISLFIKRNTMAWIALGIGGLFGLLFLAVLLLMMDFRVIC
ncbi:hypothetical protein Aeqsu_1636 [Aequorivita sublithincola DSM 14238]|uniref:Uncharacterized protein n=1 Tax=Aequorivita sublithincola (strain DSM 14238 / LMG 21431 / ACAM 643 / 9-3) TaxID=746697 RepID=I3YVV2_AEQSU|nr:hypothetical protein [Aequorivita sublithincola]AFL81120.1 hypothetical protein Aeqsu_1636 [Aequorivita sublithincola DSM 14238]